MNLDLPNGGPDRDANVIGEPACVANVSRRRGDKAIFSGRRLLAPDQHLGRHSGRALGLILGGLAGAIILWRLEEPVLASFAAGAAVVACLELRLCLRTDHLELMHRQWVIASMLAETSGRPTAHQAAANAYIRWQDAADRF